MSAAKLAQRQATAASNFTGKPPSDDAHRQAVLRKVQDDKLERAERQRVARQVQAAKEQQEQRAAELGHGPAEAPAEGPPGEKPRTPPRGHTCRD